LARLDQLLVEDRVDRWVVVTGGPGMGKSALLAAWLDRRERAGATVPHHFIRRAEYDWDDPVKLVGSLVAQLGRRFPDQREPVADANMHPAARLEAALRRISANALAPRSEQLVVVIDGLDEYDPPADLRGRDPLAAFLPRTLPAGVRVLCASRPRHPYVDMLAARGAVQLDLDDERGFGSDNAATVRAFWQQAARELGLDARFTARAVARAAGNLQHAAMLRQYLAGLPAELRRVEVIPRGLAALLSSTWERVAIDPAVVDGLGVLCAAREALTLDELGVVASWTAESQRRTFLRNARELLIESKRADGVSEYRLHHDSIRSQIVDAIGTAALRAHHGALAATLARWPRALEPNARRYALRHALIHRIEAGAWADAWRLAADMSFLEAKCRELGAHEAELNVKRLAERCPETGHEALRDRFGDLARALVRESHWLRAAPEATAALVWNRLRQLGWSADELGQQLQLAVGTRFLRVRHVATRESAALVRNLVGHAGRVTACAVTRDGRRMISASWDHTLKVWDLATGRAEATLEGHADRVTACVVTPDGRRVVSASWDRTLKVWDLTTERAEVTLASHASGVIACAVTPDGRRVVSASADKTLKVWDLETGRVAATLKGHADWVRWCAVTPDGRRVVSASADKTLKVWDLETGRVAATLKGHTDRVNACAVTRDGRRVISASSDKTLKVWDLATARSEATLEGHSSWVTACTMTPDGRHVISASDDKTLKVWDLAAGRAAATLEGHTSMVTACAVPSGAQYVVSASDDSTLKVWGLTASAPAMLQGHATRVTSCAATWDGRHVVSASDDETLKVWDLTTARAVATLEGHAARVRACAVMPDGRHVISASDDDTFKVWELETGRATATLKGHATSVSACAVMPDGRYVVSASDDKTLKVWDLETGHVVATLAGHGAGVTACAMTPDGRYVVSASWDRTLKIWDLTTGRVAVTLRGHASCVTACMVMPDGRHVVSASADTTLKVWDLATGCAAATLEGHAAPVAACAVTPDGRYVVSASEDHTVKVWDLRTGACIVTHRANAGYGAIATTATAIIAGDAAGAVWFLDWPR
jgi:WD40 repeat protein